jgi:hypothetical protein|tara:strand:- start:795 stop:926 length:132 start_codon:yes stop_codon:yes gene_type:complete
MIYGFGVIGTQVAAGRNFEAKVGNRSQFAKLASTNNQRLTGII